MTGKPCKYGHVSRRLTSNGTCLECFAIKSKSPEKRAKHKAYREANKDEIQEKQRAMYRANSEVYKERMATRYSEKKDSILEANRAYQKKNKDSLRVYQRNYVRLRRRSDENFRLKCILRNIIWKSVTHSGKKRPGGRTAELLGYQPEDLKKHISMLMTKGMTWENYGKWHIDHMRPLSTFDLSTVEGIQLANSLHNLQPMWAKKNLKKNSKWGGQLTLV